MGISTADVGTSGRGSAKSWVRPLIANGDERGGVLLAGPPDADTCAKKGHGSRALGAKHGDMTWLYALAAAAAALLALAFRHPLAYEAPALRATVEALVTLLALLATVLLGGQFWHTRRRRDLILLGALLLFTLSELTAIAVPAALAVGLDAQSAATGLLGQLFAAAAIAAAAVTPSHKLVAGGRRPLGAVVGLCLIACTSAWLAGVLAPGAFVVIGPHARLGVEHARPAALAVVLLTSGLLACGAAQFARRGDLERDGAVSLLAGALVLMTVARLYFLALPQLSPDWVSPREALRLLAMALILAAAVRRQRAVRAAMLRGAQIAERRRVARDLHDGLAQDLALIVAHAPWMAQQFGAEHPVTMAARRALEVSRGTIGDLSDCRSTKLGDALQAMAHELRGRFHMAIAVDADVDDLPAEVHRHVLRIAREAIANAGRHGDAKNVVVSLRRTRDGLALRVQDDGRGIRRSGSSPAPEGFGLRSMRERAAMLGGDLNVRERSGGGTELELVLP